MEFEQLVKPIIIIAIVVSLLVVGTPLINKVKDSFISLLGLGDELENKLDVAKKIYEQNQTSENALVVAKLYVQKGDDVAYKNAEEWFLDKVMKNKSTKKHTGENAIAFIEDFLDKIHPVGTKFKELGIDQAAVKIKLFTDIKKKWPQASDKANYLIADNFLKLEKPEYALAIGWYNPAKYNNNYYKKLAAQKTLEVYKKWLEPVYSDAENRENIKQMLSFYNLNREKYELSDIINWDCSKYAPLSLKYPWEKDRIEICNLNSTITSLETRCFYDIKERKCLSCKDMECSSYAEESCNLDPCKKNCEWDNEFKSCVAKAS